MKPRTLIVLAVLVALLGAFIYFVERDLPGTEERADLAKKLLPQLDTAEVTGVEIAWDGKTVLLERRPPEVAEAPPEGEGAAEEPEPAWYLVEPLESRADPSRVDDLLRSLADLEKKRTLEEEPGAALDLEELGLAPAQLTLSLRRQGGDSRVLRLGRELPASGDRLAILGPEEGTGAPVHVVAGDVWSDLTQDPGRWRDPRIFRAEAKDVRRVKISSPRREVPVVLARQEDGGFRLLEPVEDRASQDEAGALFRALADLRAQRFVDGTPTGDGTPAEAGEGAGEDGGEPPSGEGSDLGLEPPRARLEVTLAEGVSGSSEPVILEVGALADENPDRHYGRAEGRTFVFQSEPVALAAERSPQAWRSLSWTDLEVFEIDAVRVEDAEGTFTLRRKDGRWMRGSGEEAEELPYTPVSELLYAAVDAEAQLLLSPAEATDEGFELAGPLVTMELEIAGEGEEGDGESEGDETTFRPAQTLTLYPPKDDRVPGRSSDREAVLAFPAEHLETVRKAIRGVREAEPVEGTLPAEDESVEEEPSVLDELDLEQEEG